MKKKFKALLEREMQQSSDSSRAESGCNSDNESTAGKGATPAIHTSVNQLGTTANLFRIEETYPRTKTTLDVHAQRKQMEPLDVNRSVHMHIYKQHQSFIFEFVCSRPVWIGPK